MSLTKEEIEKVKSDFDKIVDRKTTQSQSNTIKIIICIVIVLVLAVLAYMYYKKNMQGKQNKVDIVEEK